MIISKEDFLAGKCAVKIELHLEKEICNLLKDVRKLISNSIEVEEGLYIYVKKGTWCDNINIVNKESIPTGIKPILFTEIGKEFYHEEIIL